MVVFDRSCELHLDRKDAAVAALDDQVNLMFSGPRSEVFDGRLRCLGIDARIKRHKRFEQGAE
jgi:hypothetical protein